MTKEEFTDVFRILKAECFVPETEIEAWAKAIQHYDKKVVLRNLEQYRECRRYGIRIVCDPATVAEECAWYAGYDRAMWDALEEIRRE